jgi:hypothetical protein
MNASPPRRSRRQLVLLAVIFFAPLALSFYLYYGHSGLQPGGRVNHGELVLPVRTLPQESLARLGGGETGAGFLQQKWTFLYAAAGTCDSDSECRRRLYDTRQVRAALGRDMGRVQRVFIAPAGCCDSGFLASEHPDLVTVPAAAATQLVAALPHGAGDIYIVDPLGNLMMAYDAGAPPKGLLEDMKRLLKLSHIG